MRSMLNAYSVDEITIIKNEGYTSWGEPESGSAIVVKGYVEWRTTLVRVRKAGGGGLQTPEEVMSSVVIYLPRKIERATFLGRALSHEDRIQIDGESFDRAIIEIRKPKDFSHPHYEVFLA
jgi:hypothetical protein